VGIENSITFNKKQVEEEQLNYQTLTAQLEDKRKFVDEKRLVFDEKRSATDVLRNQYQQIQRNQFDAEKKVAVADTSIQNLQRAQLQLNEEKNNRDAQLFQLENELSEKEELLETKRIDLQQLQEHHEKTKEQILETQQQLEVLRNQLAEENRKLDAKRNEHDLLKSLIDSMEGYPESVKFLHNNADWNYAAPILSDIIYVKEEYRAAVENVLEPYLSYYVVNTLQQGLQAVHLLDNNKKVKPISSF